ncbi:MAG: 4-hydroxy-tetrahydrodipicolinate reductase [Clostridia bacterium]|nr:4-hydroxy-tetrahydrodipicolinate reductase [Clostridia bacterium]
MTNIILSGCSGKMGGVITDIVKADENANIVCGLDINENISRGYPVYKSAEDIKETANVIIDFSHPSALDGILKLAKAKKIPVVLATTGYTENEIAKIKEAAEEIPVFFTFNFSLGVNLLVALSKKAAAVLGNDFDIEIVEKHHNQKLDAPSGTAIMLANALNSIFDDKMMYEYDRHSKRAKRAKNEIGIHSVRGGTIVGEHDVIFAGRDEVITLSHSAGSKQVFAAGAVKAAKFIACKAPGMYDMNDVIKF